MSENYNFENEVFKQEQQEMSETENVKDINPAVLNEIKNGLENTFRQQETEEERKFKNEVKQVKRFTERVVKNVVQDIIF